MELRDFYRRHFNADDRLAFLPDDERAVVEHYRLLNHRGKVQLWNALPKFDSVGGSPVETEDELEIRTQFGSLKWQWIGAGSRQALQRAVILAQATGQPVPRWAAQALAEAFCKYLASEGQHDLNQLLGGTGLGSGSKSEPETERIAARDHWVFINLGSLRQRPNPDTGRRFTIRAASELVAKDLEEIAEERGWTTLSADSIESYWSKRGWAALFQAQVDNMLGCIEAGNETLRDHPVLGPLSVKSRD